MKDKSGNFNDGGIKNSKGVLEADCDLKSTLETLANLIEKNPNMPLSKFACVVRDSKNHSGALLVVFGDGDPSLEISEHGTFTYCWSGAS